MPWPSAMFFTTLQVKLWIGALERISDDEVIGAEGEIFLCRVWAEDEVESGRNGSIYFFYVLSDVPKLLAF